MNTGNQGIGLLGCGAIGKGLALAVDGGKIRGARLVALFDQDPRRGQELSRELKSSPSVSPSFQEFMATEGMSLVVEAASQEAVRQHAEAIVAGGKHLMVMSAGALLDGDLRARLQDLALRMGCQVLVSSGAIGGIDAIRAAREGLEEVVLTTRKPPQTLVDVESTQGYKANLESAQVVFDGDALEAVRRFPFNVNVAATLSLAGIGPERTRVRIIADPEAQGNVHEVYARGKSGVLRFTLENVPHPDNPRTSYLALLAAIETLRDACEGGLKIGT
ncbi:MAG: aspartate dehydrogenase [Chloroflexi bacterium]|nr:aspartate dehydrogenase [Chloroflexota bacterium]